MSVRSVFLGAVRTAATKAPEIGEYDGHLRANTAVVLHLLLRNHVAGLWRV